MDIIIIIIIIIISIYKYPIILPSLYHNILNIYIYNYHILWILWTTTVRSPPRAAGWAGCGYSTLGLTCAAHSLRQGAWIAGGVHLEAAGIGFKSCFERNGKDERCRFHPGKMAKIAKTSGNRNLLGMLSIDLRNLLGVWPAKSGWDCCSQQQRG
jgi:hypothetical protein